MPNLDSEPCEDKLRTSATAAERVRQVGPNKEGAKGSYTIYRIAAAA
jgi:hypothetical protein